MRRGLAVLAFVGFGLSTILYISVLLEVALLPKPLVELTILPLCFGAILLWIIVALIAERELPIGQIRTASHIINLLPEQSRPVAIAYFNFAFINFFSSILIGKHGLAWIGHWMLFYLIPALYFWYPAERKKKKRSDDATDYFGDPRAERGNLPDDGY